MAGDRAGGVGDDAMSYVNRSTGNARSATLVAVAGLHLAAIWALIHGLGVDYIKTEVFNLKIKNYPAEPPPQPLPEPPKSKPDTDIQKIVPADPMVSKDGPMVFKLPPLDPPSLPDLVPPALPDPGPAADPGPRFDPVGPKPRSRSGQWVTTGDYPTSDIRQGNEGVVTYRLAIDASGRTTDCVIVKGSGHPGLDAATCGKLLRRASFDPARDAAGERVAAYFTGTVRWVIPQ
jgi:protein TonB